MIVFTKLLPHYWLIGKPHRCTGVLLKWPLSVYNKPWAGGEGKPWINYLLPFCANFGCWSTTVLITLWSNAIYTHMGCRAVEAGPNCPLFHTPTELSWWQEHSKAYHHNNKQLLSDGKDRLKKWKADECLRVYLLHPRPISTLTSQKILSCLFHVMLTKAFSPFSPQPLFLACLASALYFKSIKAQCQWLLVQLFKRLKKNLNSTQAEI